MLVLYPSDPLNPKQIDEAFAEEAQAVRDRGLACHALSLEDLDHQRFKVFPSIDAGQSVLYRGWMLKIAVFARMCEMFAARGCSMITSAREYERCHHLPGWYPTIADLTMKTVILEDDERVVEHARELGWTGYFVKDYVKSLNTARGSFAAVPEDIRDILNQIRHYRGEVEGGVCLRKIENLLRDSERRYFIVRGEVHSDGDIAPELVQVCAQRIDSCFYSVDVAARVEGGFCIVELGDGQVSDRKHWDAIKFARVLENLAAQTL